MFGSKHAEVYGYDGPVPEIVGSKYDNMTVFFGPLARERAEEYIAWKK